MNIQITEKHARKSPVEIQFGTLSGIIELQLAFERFLAEAVELQTACTKFNEASPVKKLDANSRLDDIIGFTTDLISDLEARPDMIREQYEGDR